MNNASSSSYSSPYSYSKKSKAKSKSKDRNIASNMVTKSKAPHPHPWAICTNYKGKELLCIENDMIYTGSRWKHKNSGTDCKRKLGSGFSTDIVANASFSKNASFTSGPAFRGDGGSLCRSYCQKRARELKFRCSF